jgi:hemolysin-activating ACP:hemolysin acyltransferase
LIFEAKKSSVFMIDTGKLYDITVAFGLYKSFPRYKDHTFEDVLEHIAPSVDLNQYKIHYKDGLPSAFTNWAFLNKDAEKRFMTTAELNPEDYNSGDIPWAIDLICCSNVKNVMKLNKKHFTNLLGFNKPVKWLRVNDNGDITRVVTRYTKEHYGVS